MTNYQLKYKPFGERSILIEWPCEIDKIILQDVLLMKSCIQDHYNELILEIKHAYNSILISYMYTIDNINDEILLLKSLYLSKKNQNFGSKKLWRIPVCYDEKFAIDLEEMATHKARSKDDIIKLHFEDVYTVFFIGFLPGFLYLEGLKNELHFPRKATPRLKILKGAVGIGGSQTGIYPNPSPGGWNIIGNSPIQFFDVKKSMPCFAHAGDNVQFMPITLEEYTEIEKLVEIGSYIIESEVIDG